MSALDPLLMQRLISSQAWRDFLSEAVTMYDDLARALDTAKDDTRYWQGAKEYVRRLIDAPYVAAQMESPLTPERPLVHRTKRRMAGKKVLQEVESPLLVKKRPSYLA